MILVDSSVWIDVLGNRTTRQTAAFDRLLKDRAIVGIGDLVIAEVLQGIRSDRDFTTTLATLRAFPMVPIADFDTAVQAARHYRFLRVRGVTIRKTIDVLIASRCIADNIPLLYEDRDFHPFVEHLGLRSALDEPGVTR